MTPPLPWSVKQHKTCFGIVDADGMSVASMTSKGFGAEKLKTVQMIVDAVNSEALEELVERFSGVAYVTSEGTIVDPVAKGRRALSSKEVAL